jgi:preprotein translocase subunit SecG
MTTILFAIHLTAALSMIVLILLQRSEGGALGMGGGGGGLVSGRGAANILTRTTSILAATFFATSISLGVLSHRPAPASTVVAPVSNTQKAPATETAPIEKAPETLPPLSAPKLKSGAAQAPAAPAQPQSPQLPQSQ